MLSGEEETLRRRALTALTEAAIAEGDFDFEVFEGGDSKPIDWVASAGTAPFLAAKRTVVVRHLLRAGDPEEAFASKTPKIALPETGLLILMVDEEVGDDSKQRRLATVRKAWEKVVSGSAGLVLQYNSNPGAMKIALRKEVEKQGKSLTSAASEALVEMTGNSLSRALEELEKLILYVGDQNQIGESDVRAAVVPAREWFVYKLVDAVVAGNVGEALKQLRLLVGTSTKAEEAAYRNIFPTLGKQLRLIWQARACVEAGCSPAQAPEEVAMSFPDRPNLSREPDWSQRRAMLSARAISFEQLSTCMRAVSDADARLKGLLPGFSSLETLERMVLDMAEVVRSKSGSVT